MLRSKFIKFLRSILNWQVNSFSIFALFVIVMTHNSLVNVKLIYFLLSIKRSHKVPIFSPLNVLWQTFAKFLMLFLKAQFSFASIFHQYSVPSNITPLYFFSSNIIYFGQKQSIKVQIFEIFECSGQNLSNSSCQFWTDKSIPPQILLHSPLSWHNSPVSFKLVHFQLSAKECHQSANFET